MYEVKLIREDFPILTREVYNKPLIYLDNAATTQKPTQVIDAITQQYVSTNANVHRGVHFLSQQSTTLHEGARKRVATFLNAPSTDEIIFTRGTTESINLVAYSFGEAFLEEGDEVIISAMEHHANIVPWQLLEKRKGIKLRIVHITPKGELDLTHYQSLFNKKTKLVSITYVSNVLGTVNPIKEIGKIAHSNGVPILVDGAQSVAHMPVDVQDLACDFFVCSAHKMYGPTGLGVLYGKRDWLDKMPPYQGGGEMIAQVSFEQTTFQEIPFKFEAGTPDYIGAYALAKAIDYITNIGLDNIQAYEQSLLTYAMQAMKSIPNIVFYGESEQKEGVISFNVKGIHPSDLGTLLDRLGIAIRTGHHCAQPLMKFYGVEGMARASFALYNTKEEVDSFVEALQKVIRMF